MKKIFYLIAALGLTWTVVSCDNEPKNPGDYSIKSEMSLSDIVSQTNGQVYQLKVAREIDSVFGTNVTVYDTIWDENGEYVSRESRNVWIESKFTTKFVEYEPITVSAYPDTFQMNVTTNARWISPQVTRPRGASQFYNDATTGGGGNGIIIFRSEINENATRIVPYNLNVYSSDSTVYHCVPLLQEGLK